MRRTWVFAFFFDFSVASFHFNCFQCSWQNQWWSKFSMYDLYLHHGMEIAFSADMHQLFAMLVILLRNINKIVGYHRHILRLPIFVKKAFEKVKTFFSRENTLSSSYFLIFFNVQKFLIFCQKSIIIRAEKTFLRNITI